MSSSPWASDDKGMIDLDVDHGDDDGERKMSNGLPRGSQLAPILPWFVTGGAPVVD